MVEQSTWSGISPEHLQTLYTITCTMNSSLDFDEVLNTVMDSVMHVTKAQRGFLMIEDESIGDLRVLVARGMSGENLAEEDAYSTTIVKQVVTTRQPLLTNNAQAETRYTPGASIIMRGLRAILCVPMMVHDRLIGVVYVDTSMRAGTFTDADRDLMTAVAGQAGIAIENARLYRVAVEKGRMERELQMTREIQEGLLPSKMPQLQGYDLAAHWQSAREVAGDFYDVFKLGDDVIGVVIADVSDKGAPAALFMASTRSLIRSYAYAGGTPVQTLQHTNDLILEDAEGGGMFVTAYHSLFRSSGQSVHVNAGHNPPLLYRAKGNQVSFMSRGGRAIGWFPDNPLQEVELQLQPGDVLVYYTDGLTDAETHAGDYFGEERLAKAVKEVARQPAEAIARYIVKSVEAFCAGASPFDDLTLFIVRYTG